MTNGDLNPRNPPRLPIHNAVADVEVPSGSHKTKNAFSPNEPHPSLEFPLLYFALARMPTWREKIRGLYSMRWSMSYRLQRRVPMSRLLRNWKIYLTYGEILIVIPLAALALLCIYQTLMVPDVVVTGRIARLAVVAALLFAQKNSYITMVLGVPFDRAVVYHKISGYVAVITGLLHAVAFMLDQPAEEVVLENGVRTLQRGGGRGGGGRGGGRGGGGFDNGDGGFGDANDGGGNVDLSPPTVAPTLAPAGGGDDPFSTVTAPASSSGFERRDLLDFFDGSMNLSGTMILLFMLGIFVTSLPAIRRRLFEFFYFAHLTFLVGVIGATAVHTGLMVPLTVLLTTGVDLFIRKVVMARFRYPRKATLKIISESVVEVSFPKVAGFDYNPGQYVYIAIPELSSFEWHPFSLSSAPHESRVTMHIRDAGHWTFALYRLALQKSEVPFLMEGPYGNFGVDVMNEKRYKVALLLSGGIGLTPMQSMFSHLLHEHSNGSRDLKKLKFLWIQRDPELMIQSGVAHTSAELNGSSPMAMPMPQHDRRQGESSSLAEDDCVSLASRILSSIPPSIETDADLNAAYMSTDLLSDVGSRGALTRLGEDETIATFDDSTIANKTRTIGGDSRMGADLEAAPGTSADGVIDIEIYLTKLMYGSAHNIPGVKQGRPDLAATFVALKEEAIRLGEKRVAVCVCGPKRIAHLSRKACIELSDKNVRFDYHEEAFG